MRIRLSTSCVLISFVGMLLLATTGCQGFVHGRWHMIDARPNPETFAIDDVEFKKDGTFAATITIEGRTAQETGEYDFNGFKLRLRPQAGGERSYQAALQGRTLEVIDGSKKVILRRGEAKR